MTKEVDAVKSLKILHCNNISLGEIFLTFNSHKWSRQNFSLQYQYTMKQISDESKEQY